MNFKERHNAMKKQLMALVAAFSVVATLQAAPAQFSYQGVLTDTNGRPVSGIKEVKVRLYSLSSGGSALWGHKYSPQVDRNGLFNIEVSDNTGTVLVDTSRTLEDILANTDVIYIGIEVGGTSGEITPRQKLLPVPFAAVASNVSRASGNFSVSGALTAKDATFSRKLTASSLNVTGAASVGTVTSDVATVTGNLTVGGTISGFGIAPIGSIIMWSGAKDNIPQGWVLCDGNNSTPDLRGKFILGAGGKYNPNDVGGSETVTLTLDQMPRHRHEYKFKGADNTGGWDSDNIFYDSTSHYNDDAHSNTKVTEYTGGNSNGDTEPHNNMPPYYALCFIMRKN